MNAKKIIKVLKVANKGNKGRFQLFVSTSQVNFFNGDCRLTVFCDNGNVGSCSFNSFEELELQSSIVGDFVPTACEYGKEYIASELSDKMSYCLLAIDDYATRYALGGINFDDSHIVATDGRRMHFVSSQLVEDVFTSDKRSRIVPAVACKALLELIKVFQDDIVKVYFNRDCIVASGNCWNFEAKLVEGRFPNWQAIVVDYNELDKAEHVLFVKQLRLHLKDVIKRTNLENKVETAGMAKKERKSFNERTPQVKIDKVLLDARYLLDAIENVKEATVELWLAKHGNGACRVGDAVVMPLSK